MLLLSVSQLIAAAESRGRAMWSAFADMTWFKLLMLMQR